MIRLSIVTGTGRPLLGVADVQGRGQGGIAQPPSAFATRRIITMDGSSLRSAGVTLSMRLGCLKLGKHTRLQMLWSSKASGSQPLKALKALELHFEGARSRRYVHRSR